MQTRFQKLLVVAWLAACVLVAPALAVEYFVAPGGADGNGGSGWSDAFATISNAVARADATIVTVSNGTYNTAAQIFVTKAITIRSFGGGIHGGLANATNTIVDRGRGIRVFNLSDAGAVLDGLTITGGGGGGKYNPGKGIYMTGGSVLNCVVKENGTGQGHNDGNAGGGGIYMTGGLVSNCTIKANQLVEFSGAGVSAGGSSTITHCRILENVQWAHYNHPTHGGGIYASSASVRIRNCLVAGNVIRQNGGGIYGGTVENCTVVSNRTRSAEASGGGVYLTAGSTVSNSIVYFNTVDGVHSNLNTTVGMGYSCFTLPDGTNNGNISDDPQFVDLAGGNYRLLESSPCLNSGDSSVVDWATDLDGNYRTKGIVDMGCYEFQPPAGSILIVR